MKHLTLKVALQLYLHGRFTFSKKSKQLYISRENISVARKIYDHEKKHKIAVCTFEQDNENGNP